MLILQRVRNAGMAARARVVRWLNRSSAALVTAVGAAYAKYPDSVKHFVESVPGWLAFPAAVAFFLLIEGLLKHPKDAGK
jgi:hypothetical protein